MALLASLAAACSGSGAAKEPEKGAAPAAPPVLDIGKENTVTVATDEIVTGPAVSGTLSPKDQATVRAEVGGSVLSAGPKQGQAVRRGQLLARIEARTAGEAVTSAESSVRSQEQALDLARRELARAEKLVSAGAVAERSVEAARNEVVRLESEMASAKSRLDHRAQDARRRHRRRADLAASSPPAASTPATSSPRAPSCTPSSSVEHPARGVGADASRCRW